MEITEIEEDSKITKSEECAGFYLEVCLCILKVEVMHITPKEVKCS